MSVKYSLANAENTLRAARTRFKLAWAGFIFFFGGGFIILAAAGDDGVGMFFIMDILALCSITLAGDNGAAAQEDIDRLKASIQSAKRREKAQRRQVKKRERELGEAKRLMEKGGIDNLNRAIGIFEKYGKK
jgi:outer membrane protein TolC